MTTGTVKGKRSKKYMSLPDGTKVEKGKNIQNFPTFAFECSYVIGRETDTANKMLAYGEYATVEDAANARAYAKVVGGLKFNIYKLTIKKERAK